MSTPKPSRLDYWFASFILIAACLHLAVSCYHTWGFTTDDAFISWRYAKHLAEGYGLRWNPTGAPVEGYSNFSWVILASLFIKLGLPVTTAIKCFSCISLAAALFFLYQLSRTFLSVLTATLPVYLFSHYIGIVWWTLSGLETSFFVALVLFVTWQSVRALKPNHFNTTAWILACSGLTLLALTRFDGIVWSMIIGVFTVCSLRHSVKLKTHSTHLLLIFMLCFVLPYSLYFAWRLYYFGQIVPNSYACKAFTTGHTFQLAMDYLTIAFPCLILGLPYFFTRKDCRHTLLWLPSFIYALLLYHADPMIAHYNRLSLGAFSVFVILPILGTQEFFSYFHCKEKHNALATSLVILIFTYIFIPNNSINNIKASVKHYQQRSDVRLQLAQQLNREASFGAHVLIADCGVIPFFTRINIVFIDSLCLNNKDMTHNSLPNYAKHIKDILKPEWVIETYYPRQKRRNELNNALQKINFFNDYKRVLTYQPHGFSSEQEADLIYWVYKRND